MDSKSFLRTLLIAGALTLGLLYFMNSNKKADVPPPAAAAGAGMDNLPMPGQPLPETKPADLLRIGSAAKGSPYFMEVEVTPRGAGVQSVRLNVTKAAETIANTTGYQLITPPTPGQRPSFSVYSTHVDRSNFSYPTGNTVWQVRTHTDSDVVLYQRLKDYDRKDQNGVVQPGKELVELERTYHLDPGTYELRITQRIRNLTDAPLTVTVDQLGPSELPNDNVTDFRTYHGTTYNTAKQYIQADATVEAQISVAGEKADPNKYALGNFQGTDHLVWVAASNSFFASIVRPLGTPGAPQEKVAEFEVPAPQFLAQASAQPISMDKKVAGIVLQGQPLQIAAAGTAEMPLTVFLGPKARDLLSGDIHAAQDTPLFAYALYKYISIIQFSRGGLCALCTFNWLAMAILWLLDKIHYITFGNYGVAIILLVILVRLALHPLTRYSQVNMARFQKQLRDIQPELDKIKKRYKGTELREQQMKLYQEKKINQAAGLLGCLPMVLQMPIWIALYSGLAADIDLRHATFIPGWITDLSMPDILHNFVTPFHVWVLGYVHGDTNYVPINLLPLLLGAAFFFQMRFQMKSQPAPADEQQAQMQKISQYSILLFPLFLYNAPSGLNVYIFASTAGGLFDTWLVRKQLRREGLLPPPRVKAVE